LEQQDSLKLELENLARIQTEQVNILKNMSASNETENALKTARENQQKVNFDTPAMYQNVSQNFGNNTGQVQFGPSPMISSYAQSMNANFANSVSSLAGKQGQYGFLGVAAPTTNSSDTSRVLMGMDYSARLSQTAMTGMGAVASTASSFGLGAMLPGMAGIGTGILGGALVGGYVDIANDEIQKNSSLKKYLYKNSGMFIDSSESNNERGLLGFSRKESDNAANYVRKMNDDFHMSDDDTMMLLQKYTEGGLLKDTKDLDGFKKKMASLTKTVKEGALMLNETYDSVAELMSAMKKAGIDQKDYKDLMGKSNILGGLTGESGSSVARSITDFVQQLNSGTSNDGSKTTSRTEDTTAYVASYFNELDNKFNTDKDSMTVQETQNRNMITNLGGPTQASMYTQATLEKMVDQHSVTTSALGYFDWDAKQKDFVFNQSKFNDYKNKNLSVEQITEIAEKKLQGYEQSGQGDAIKKWDSGAGTYIKNAMSEGDMTDAIAKAVSTYTNDKELKAQGFDDRTIMSDYFGVKDMGVQNLLNGFFDYKKKNPQLAKQISLQEAWQSTTTSQLANAPSVTERLSAWWDRTKDSITQGAVDLDSWVGEKLQYTQDWMAGTLDIPQRYDRSSKTKSDLKSTSYDEVIRKSNETNNVIASSLSSLNDLQDKGYQIDDNIMHFVSNKFKNSSKQVNYDRDIISNWDEVSSGIKEQKSSIIENSKKNDLSEVIVAALAKYNQSKPQGQQLNIDQTSSKLGDQVFKYGGNYGAALAVTVGGASQDSVDKAFKNLGYDMGALRTVGGQGSVKDINIDSLKLGDEVSNRVKEIFNEKIGQSTTTSVSSGSGSVTVDQMRNQNLKSQTSVTAEQVDAFIADKVGGRQSNMTGKGATFLKASQESGLDVAYLVAHAGNESAWGTSQITKNKNNWFGIGAFDNSAYSSAYGYGTAEAGIIGGAKWIADNYVNDPKHQQNTLNAMVNDKAGWHNYATDPNWSNLNGQLMKEFHDYTQTGAGSSTTTESGVNTKKESVTRNFDGSKVLKEIDIAKALGTTEAGAKEYLLGQKGFASTQNDKLVSSQDKFLSEVKLLSSDEVNKNSTETRKDYAADIEKLLSDKRLKGDGGHAIVEHGRSTGYNPEKAGYIDSITSYSKRLDELLTSGDYNSASDALSDKKLADYKKTLVGKFKDGADAENYIQGLNGEAEVQSKQRVLAKNTSNSTAEKEGIRKSFARDYMGVRIEDFEGNIGKYNMTVDTAMENYYGTEMKQLNSFSNEEYGSENFLAWRGKSAADKENTLAMLKKVGMVIGSDRAKELGGGKTSESLVEEKGKNWTHTDDENKLLTHLKKQKNGGFIYDSEYDSSKQGPNQDGSTVGGTAATWDDYSAWRKQGEKRDEVSSINSAFKTIANGNIGLDGTNTDLQEKGKSISSMKSKISATIDEITAKNDIEINKEGGVMDTVRSIKENKEDALKGVSEEYRKQIASDISSGDVDDLKKLGEALKGSIDEGTLTKYIEFAKTVGGVDVTNLSKLTAELDKIEERAVDIGKTTTILEAELGDGFKGNFESKANGTVKSTFGEDTELGKLIKDNNLKTSDLMKILENGGNTGIKGEDKKPIVLSADSIQALSAAMAEATQKTLTDTLSSSTGQKSFEDSGTYKAIVNALKDTKPVTEGDGENAKAVSFEQANKDLEKINTQIEEFVKKAKESGGLSKEDEQKQNDLKDQQKQLVDGVVKVYDESLKTLTDQQKDGASKIDDAKTNSEKLASSFESTMKSYDTSIGNAITTMNNRINSMGNSTVVQYYNPNGGSYPTVTP